MELNTFMKLLKVLIEENKNQGLEGIEEGLLPLKSTQNSKESQLQGPLSKENQKLKLSNGDFLIDRKKRSK